MSGEGRDEARAAGRGLVFIAGAKAYFIVTAYAVHFLLPRLLGSPEAFGLFTTALSAMSILNNVLIAATVQTVSKLVSEDDARAPHTLRQGLKLQLVLGAALAGAGFIAAPWLAAVPLRDAALEPMLRVACAVILAYALYAALVGSLNGRRLFFRQAALDATFSTLRVSAILTGAAVGVSLGFGALGAMIGFGTAAVTVLSVAAITVGLGRSGKGLPLERWRSFMTPLWIFHFFLNGVLLADVLVMKNTIAGLSLDAGMTSEAAASVASEYVGYYGAAQKFALVPYQLMLSLTFIVFPMISKATSQGDHAAARATIRGAMRFALLIIVSAAAPIAGAADGVMRLAFPPAYLVGSGALGVLVFGAAAFSLFVITATAMTGSGRPSLALFIAAAGLVTVVVCNRLFVTWVGVGAHTTTVAAAATSLGMFVCMIAGGVVTHRLFGAFMAPKTVVRCLLAGALAFAAARFIPHDTALGALAALAGGFVAYFVGLALVRELRQEDFDLIRRVIGRRKAVR